MPDRIHPSGEALGLRKHQEVQLGHRGLGRPVRQRDQRRDHHPQRQRHETKVRPGGGLLKNFLFALNVRHNYQHCHYTI